ncbi:MAG: hypothetical protein H7A24_03215 [Leptospiraceae bacterium]|nr:hypothetical protein [Leptospiraceae bacterium]MCP5510859.1 hypothetical protein [Leptospiraceae bacterium]
MKYILLFSLIFFSLHCASDSNKPGAEGLDETGRKFKILKEKSMERGTEFSVSSRLLYNENGDLVLASLGSAQPILQEKYSRALSHVFPKGTALEYEPPVDLFGAQSPNPEKPFRITLGGPMEVYGIPLQMGSVLSLSYPKRFNEKSEIGILVERTFQPLEINGKKIPSGVFLLIESKEKQKYKVEDNWIDLQ